MDKTLTNIGQKLDKTWTFVKKLSKFCLTHHSTGAPILAELKEDDMREEGMKGALLWKEVGYRYDMWRVADDDGRDSRRESDAVTS